MHSFSLFFIISCFIILAIVWITTAFNTKKIEQKAGGWTIRLIFYAIILLVIYLQKNVQLFTINLWPENTLTLTIADISVMIGLCVMIRSRVTLGRNWSANIVLKEDHKLITTGPYAYVRHPIYAGLILMVLGVVICANTLILAIFFICFFFGAYYKAMREEKLLITNFPIEYPEYINKTKALIPFVF